MARLLLVPILGLSIFSVIWAQIQNPESDYWRELSVLYEGTLSFRCTHCRTKTKKAMSFTTEASVPVVGGRGHVNLAFKCKECTRVSTITVLGASLRPYTAQDDGTFQRFIELDCRGCSPTTFRPLGQFTCTNTQGDRQFASVDLTKSQWIDRTHEETVGVHEFTYQFKVYRK